MKKIHYMGNNSKDKVVEIFKIIKKDFKNSDMYLFKSNGTSKHTDYILTWYIIRLNTNMITDIQLSKIFKYIYTIVCNKGAIELYV